MRGKKRKSSEIATRGRSKKKTEIKQAETEVLSLPVLSEEQIYAPGHMRTRATPRVPRKLPDVPKKVKITCLPLNVEKIIDYENNRVIVNKIRKGRPKATSVKTSQIKTRNSKVESNDSFEDIPLAVLMKSKFEETKVKRESEKISNANKPALANKSKPVSNSIDKVIDEVVSNSHEVNSQEESVINNSLSTAENNNSLSIAEETNVKSQTLTTSTQENNEEEPVLNINHDIANDQNMPYNSPFCDTYDESVFMQLNDINLTELTPISEHESGETDMKWSENLHESNSLNFTNSAFLGFRDPYRLNGANNHSKISLQNAVENFLSNPQLNSLNESSDVKRGLCITWLSNNYVCSNKQCLYSHCALKLFKKKLKSYSSKFVINVVGSMRNDVLFVDVIMAAFQVLSERKVPVIWVTFLTYLVFHVTEPSDSRFLKFWANAARFYCQLNTEFTAASGFASLLSIFSEGGASVEWKIIEFIKLIKRPPIQVSTSYELLQPVMKMDIPVKFLVEAIEFSIATQKDLLNVFTSIIPKISLMTSPIQTIEVLLKFSTTLEANDLKSHADDLKRRMREKVKSFQTKITCNDFPLTAAFQEDLLLSRDDCLSAFQSVAASTEHSEAMESPQRKSYFRIEDDFYHALADVMGLPCVAASATKDVQLPVTAKNNEAQENVICERQLGRIRQFFRDHQFDLLGKYLNDLKSNILEQAAKEFLKLLFHMRISLQQGVDLVKIILLSCKSVSAANVIASVCATLTINLVKINEWEKAYNIVSLCQEKEINVMKGKVFAFNHQKVITQCRLALLLIEISATNGDYQSAMLLIKDNFLFSSNTSLWNLTWKANDEIIRIMILEDFLQLLVSKQLTEKAYDLFMTIWNEQKELSSPIDLRKFVNEMLILLLNQGNEEAMTLYERVQSEVQLNDITIRAILVTLVRQNQLSAAKRIILSTDQNVYCLLEISSGCNTVLISRSWLEEEIFLMFDAFLEQVASKKHIFISSDSGILEVNVQVLKDNSVSSSRIRPLCLGVIKPSLEDICNRIQRVLLYQFNPPLKLIETPYSMKLDDYTLQVHLSRRVSQSLRDLNRKL